MSTLNSAAKANDRAAWVEPAIIELDVAETAANIGTGADGSSTDFTKS